MQVPYLMQVPERDELWLIDGEQRFLITPKIYDLLASSGADLPPAYGIEKLREQNARLRKIAYNLYEFAYAEYPSAAKAGFADDLRELGIEVD